MTLSKNGSASGGLRGVGDTLLCEPLRIPQLRSLSFYAIAKLARSIRSVRASGLSLNFSVISVTQDYIHVRQYSRFCCSPSRS